MRYDETRSHKWVMKQRIYGHDLAQCSKCSLLRRRQFWTMAGKSWPRAFIYWMPKAPAKVSDTARSCGDWDAGSTWKPRPWVWHSSEPDDMREARSNPMSPEWLPEYTRLAGGLGSTLDPKRMYKRNL